MRRYLSESYQVDAAKESVLQALQNSALLRAYHQHDETISPSDTVLHKRSLRATVLRVFPSMPHRLVFTLRENAGTRVDIDYELYCKYVIEMLCILIGAIVCGCHVLYGVDSETVPAYFYLLQFCNVIVVASTTFILFSSSLHHAFVSRIMRGMQDSLGTARIRAMKAPSWAYKETYVFMGISLVYACCLWHWWSK